tara:strand:+ start:3503 stop:3862 length:360 start_codon:yes stop_codon:yes gene_type:complete
MTSYKDINLLNLDFNNIIIKSPVLKCSFSNKEKILIVPDTSDNNHNRTMDIITHIKRLSKSEKIFDEFNNGVFYISNKTKFFDKNFKEIEFNKTDVTLHCKLLFKYEDEKLFLIQCLIL